MKATVLDLAQQIAHGQADVIPLNHYYDDLMVDFQRQAVFTVAALIPVVAEQAVYTLPDATHDLLAVFYDDTMLSKLTLHEMQMLDPQWRDRIGSPIGYLVDEQSDREIRLYPKPKDASAAFNFPTGMPLGADFPRGALTLLSPELRQDLPEWLDLALAYRIVGKEFMRESAHRDPKFAGACAAIADMLQGLLL